MNLANIRKHLYIIMASILLFSTGVFLFLWQASDTFAWSSNNDLIEYDYWNNDRDGSSGMIINALYGDGIGQADKTFYTQYWNTHLCDPNTFDVQFIAPGTDTLPPVLAANTIYVLATGDHNMSYSMQFAGDCTAVVGKSQSDMIIARVKYLPSANSGVFIIQSNNRNIIINNMQIQEQVPANANAGNPAAGVYIQNANANTVWPGQGSNASYGVYVGSSTDITIGGGVSDNPYGHYVVDSNDINIGTPWPITLPWENGTGVYVANSTNVIIDADPRDNTSMGMHIYNSTGIRIRSRYIALNESPGTLIENVYNSRINGAHGGNLGYGVKIINSHNITGGMTWPQLNNPTYYGQNNSNNIGVDAHGLIIDASTDIYFTGLYLSFNDGYGLYITDSSNIGLGYVTTIGNDLGGIYMSGVDNLSINRISITGNQNDGIYIQSTNNIRLQSGYIAQNIGDGIHASGLAIYHTYTDNYITGNGDNGIYRQAGNDLLAYNTIENNDISSNGDAGLRMEGQGSQLVNNVISNNDIYENTSNGMYMKRGYYNLFDANNIYTNGANGIHFYQNVDNEIINQDIAYNATNGIYVEGFSNLRVYDSYIYDNANHGVYTYNFSNAYLSGLQVYDNAADGIYMDNTNNSFVENTIAFNNVGAGIHGYQSDANTLRYIQSYNNQDGLRIEYGASENFINNILAYNNTANGIIIGVGTTCNTLNNFATFNNVNGLVLDVDNGEINANNVINNGNIFNNQINGFTINGSDADSSSGHLINNINIYNNQYGLRVYGDLGDVVSNEYYGYLDFFANDTDITGTDGDDAALSAGSSNPLGWAAGILGTPSNTMTCNRAIQASNNIFEDLLSYVYCSIRGVISWTATPDVQYTFFPEIALQQAPVQCSASVLSVGSDYEEDMFVGDRVWYGTDTIGGHVSYSTTGVSYISGGFTYGNYPHMLQTMVVNTGTPDYIHTGVGNTSYDGISTTYGGVFQSPLTDTIGLPLVNQQGIRIVRTSYSDGQNISNYYGLIKGLAYDDISITKTASTGVIQEGTQIGFTITVTNSGALAGTSQVFDFLPWIISSSGLQTDPVGVYSGDYHAIIWDMPEVAEDTIYTFTVTGYVQTGFIGQTFINTGYFISDYTHSGADLILYSEALFSIAGCSDGNIGEGEQCDDGNTSDNDGCSMTCQIENTVCTIQGSPTAGEIPLLVTFVGAGGTGMIFDYIDYGDGTTGTDFSHTYTSEGVYTPIAYQYNIYSGSSYNTCSSTDIVTSSIECGDGITEGTEQCDDGANNGVLCDPSYNDSCDYCDNACTISTIQGGSCGDSIVEAAEQCDEGANNGMGGCAENCEIRFPSCTLSSNITTGTVPLSVIVTGIYPDFASLGYIDYDDGGTGTDFEHTYTEPGNNYAPTMYVYNTSYPATTALCQSDGIYVAKTYCGDSIIQTPNSSGQVEVCDSGVNNGLACDPSYGSSCNYCTNSCTTSSITGGYCGDGITEDIEQCDDGNSNDSDLCSNTCTATCGDGDLDGSEQCDLGEDNGLGACTSSCLFAAPLCTIAAPDYSNGIVPVYVPFTVNCLDYAELAYIDYGDGTTGTNFSGHTYTTIGSYTPIIYFRNILGGPLADDDDDLEVSTTAQRCGDGIKNGAEQCDGGSQCTTSCKYRKNKPVDPVVQKDICPEGDFSASYYDKTCGVKSQHAAAEILDKYSIIHGDYNKGPEDPARYSLDRILKRSELRKIMVRTITDQKYDAPFAGETWADKYQMIMQNTLGIVYGQTRSHEDQVTYLEAINSVLEGLYHLGKLQSPVTLRSMVGGSRPITRGQMMALIVRFILPEALQSVQQDMAKLRK